MDGDEVVLIYLNDVVSSVATPVRKLVAFERVSLKKEESRTLSYTIENRHLAFLGRDMKPVNQANLSSLSGTMCWNLK
jgi:beta-glucosidase